MGVNDYDEQLYYAIQDLVDEGELETGTPAHGIAKRVIDSGYDSLSDKQKWIYDKHVWPLLIRQAEERYVQYRIASAGD